MILLVLGKKVTQQLWIKGLSTTVAEEFNKSCLLMKVSRNCQDIQIK